MEVSGRLTLAARPLLSSRPSPNAKRPVLASSPLGSGRLGARAARLGFVDRLTMTPLSGKRTASGSRSSHVLASSPPDKNGVPAGEWKVTPRVKRGTLTKCPKPYGREACRHTGERYSPPCRRLGMQICLCCGNGPSPLPPTPPSLLLRSRDRIERAVRALHEGAAGIVRRRKPRQ